MPNSQKLITHRISSGLSKQKGKGLHRRKRVTPKTTGYQKRHRMFKKQHRTSLVWLKLRNLRD